MPGHIGIVACSAEGAALCYRTICLEGTALLGAHAHPEVSLHSHSLADYMECIYRGDWPAVGELMLSSAHKLARTGADFLICPDNTIHQALRPVEARSPLPWLHIADVVAAQAVERGFRRVGLTGTRWLVESDVYPEQLTARGLEYVRPEAAEREEINRIIMDELVNGLFLPGSLACFQRVIERMKGQGCDAVILGCTEIPLIVNDENSPLPTLDSTRLLARAALRRALLRDPLLALLVPNSATRRLISRAASRDISMSCYFPPTMPSSSVRGRGKDVVVHTHRVPPSLRERLGDEATAGLVDVFDQHASTWTADVIAIVTERFERRVVEEASKLRVDMAQGFGKLREEMAQNRVELLKWAFLFWAGQSFAVASLTALLVRILRPGV